MVDKPAPPTMPSSSQDSLMQELVEMMKAQRESIEQLRQTIDRQTDTIEQQTKTIEQLQQTITEKDEQIGLVNRMLFGKKSERFVSVDRQVKKKRKKDPEKAAEDKAEADAERKQNKEIMKALPEEAVEHPVSTVQCRCPFCDGTEYKPLGCEESVQYEYVPPRFKQIVHRREQKVQCSRTKTIRIIVLNLGQLCDKALLTNKKTIAGIRFSIRHAFGCQNHGFENKEK